MTFSTFKLYLSAFIPDIPLSHWPVLAVMSLTFTLLLLRRRGYPVFCGFVFFAAVMLGSVLLDSMVLIRLFSDFRRSPGFDLAAEWRRLFHGSEEYRMLALFNVASFVPSGILHSVFLLASGRFSLRQSYGIAVLSSFGLSLSIECLQLASGTGVFELTDLMLNTLGATIGVSFIMLPAWVISLCRRGTAGGHAEKSPRQIPEA